MHLVHKYHSLKTMSRHRHFSVPVFSCQNLCTVLSFILISVSHISAQADFFEEHLFQLPEGLSEKGTLDPDVMAGMECYECTENPEEDGMMQCKVEEPSFNQNFEQILSQIEMIEEEDDEDELMNKIMSLKRINPCQLVTNKVLQLVQTEEESLLPVYLDLDGKDPKTKYEELKDAISTIQFQKREHSAWMAVEVQLKKKDASFSFILPDLYSEFRNFPENVVFYASL